MLDFLYLFESRLFLAELSEVIGQFRRAMGAVPTARTQGSRGWGRTAILRRHRGIPTLPSARVLFSRSATPPLSLLPPTRPQHKPTPPQPHATPHKTPTHSASSLPCSPRRSAAPPSSSLAPSSARECSTRTSSSRGRRRSARYGAPPLPSSPPPFSVRPRCACGGAYFSGGMFGDSGFSRVFSLDPPPMRVPPAPPPLRSGRC